MLGLALAAAMSVEHSFARIHPHIVSASSDLWDHRFHVIGVEKNGFNTGIVGVVSSSTRHELLFNPNGAVMHPNPTSAGQPADHYRLSTEAFAQQHLVLPQTVRKQYAANGSYFGIRPLPLPNRKLLWPDDSIKQLVATKLGGEAA